MPVHGLCCDQVNVKQDFPEGHSKIRRIYSAVDISLVWDIKHMDKMGIRNMDERSGVLEYKIEPIGSLFDSRRSESLSQCKIGKTCCNASMNQIAM